MKLLYARTKAACEMLAFCRGTLRRCRERWVRLRVGCRRRPRGQFSGCVEHTRTFPRRPRDDARIAGGEPHASSHSRVIYTPAERRLM
jgi:hypothetical protein